MVSITFTTIAVGALITLITLIQPVPAPPVVIIPIGCAFIPVGLIGLSVAAGLEVSHHPHKRDLPPTCPAHPRFSACSGDEATKDTNITIHNNNKQSIIVDGLSLACIAQVQEYNSQPDPKGLDGEGDGTVTVLNDTTVQIDGLPEEFVKKYLEAHNNTTAS